MGRAWIRVGNRTDGDSIQGFPRTLEDREKNMRFARELLLMGVAVNLASGLWGCDKKDSGQKAGEAVDKALQKAGESVEKAGKEIQESTQ